jgi:hypothetical protein
MTNLLANLSTNLLNGLSNFVRQTTQTSETGFVIGSLIGLGLGTSDYLQMRRSKSRIDNVLSVMLPTALGGVCGIRPAIGIPMLTTICYLHYKQENQIYFAYEEENILPESIETIIEEGKFINPNDL